MGLEGLKYELDQQKDLTKKGSDAEMNDNADGDQKKENKEGVDKTQFLRMTPDQEKQAEAQHQKYTELMEQGQQESHIARSEAKDVLAEGERMNIDWP